MVSTSNRGKKHNHFVVQRNSKEHFEEYFPKILYSTIQNWQDLPFFFFFSAGIFLESVYPFKNPTFAIYQTNPILRFLFKHKN